MLNKEKPLVSIIIPSFNREKLISETIDSVLAQTYKNWECIIVDDGSTDNTINVVKEYIKNEKRLKLFQRDRLPKGANTCRNIGFEKAQGEFINWFDSDDIMLPNFLEKKVNFLISNFEYDMLVCKSINFTSSPYIEYTSDYKLKSPNIWVDFMKYNIKFFSGGPMFRKTMLDNFNILFKEGQLKHQETELYFRILIFLQAKYGTINDILFKIRNHTDNITSSVSWIDDIMITSTINLNRYSLLKTNNLLGTNELKYFEKTLFENINNYFQLKYYNRNTDDVFEETLKSLNEILSKQNLSVLSLIIKKFLINYEIIKGFLKLFLKRIIRFK